MITFYDLFIMFCVKEHLKTLIHEVWVLTEGDGIQHDVFGMSLSYKLLQLILL